MAVVEPELAVAPEVTAEEVVPTQETTTDVVEVAEPELGTGAPVTEKDTEVPTSIPAGGGGEAGGGSAPSTVPYLALVTGLLMSLWAGLRLLVTRS